MSADETGTTTPEEPAIEAWSCAGCGAEETDGESQRSNLHGEPLCETCETCADCDEDLSSARENAGSNCDGYRVCGGCAEDYVYSNAQDETLRREDAVWIEDEGEYVSQGYAARNYFYHEDVGEWHSYEPEDQLLYEYGEDALDHVTFDKAALRRGDLLLGVELEMQPNGSHEQKDVVEALGGREHDTFILKYDGSVPYGAELVTAPMTLAEHRGGRLDWPRLLENVRGIAMSGAGTTACGMHVHANKAAISPLTIGKLLVFLNGDRTDELVRLIAQRDGNTYCEKKDKRIGDGKYQSESRYERLNVTARTIEYRIFRGNLRAERVLKNLEFVVASIAYCGEASIRTVDDPTCFLAWLSTREKDYPYLAGFLREKNALKPAKAKKEKKACA